MQRTYLASAVRCVAVLIWTALPAFAGGARVMTFNIQHGVGLDGRLSLNRTASTIAFANPDIVGLEEVDVRFSPRSNCQDQFAELAKLLPQYPYRYFGASLVYPADLFQCGYVGQRMYGNAIFSKFPFSAAKYSLPSQGGESRTISSAVVNAGWGRFIFHVTHLSVNNDFERNSQAVSAWQIINTYTQSYGLPTVLVGDMNAAHFHWSLQPFWSRFNEATYVNRGLVGQVDLLYYGSANVVFADLVDIGASDHSARYADMSFP